VKQRHFGRCLNRFLRSMRPAREAIEKLQVQLKLPPQLLYAARNILAVPQWVVATSRTNTQKTDPSVAFGELLRKQRAHKKMSQDALAAKAGYERAFISLIERGKTNPSLRSIFDICTALDIRPSVFIRRVEKAANFELLREP
jgi:DNA-binding XRE family transcriptional regulator